MFLKFRSPLLHELHVGGVIIPPDSIPSSSLSRLSMTLTAAGEGGDTMEYLVGILKGGVRLVSLILDIWPVGTKIEDWDATWDPISLPELRELTMKGTLGQCSSTYSMLLAPSLEKIHLDIGHSSMGNIAQYIPRCPPGDHLHIKIDGTTICLEFGDSGRSAHGRFLFTLISHYGEGFRLFPSVLGSLHISKITFVEFSTSTFYDLAFMSSLLSRFSALHSLHLQYTSEKLFPVEDAIRLGMLRSEKSPLRSLQSLVFRNFAVVMPQASPFLIELCAIVRERGQSGLPPLVPQFESCQGVTEALLRVCGLKPS